MGKVTSALSMSLDGFIAGANDGPGLPVGEGGERLLRWYYSGDTELRVPNGLGEMTFKLSPASADVFREAIEATGALVAGRRTFDIAKGWGGRHPVDVPVFIVTHSVPPEWGDTDAPFTFITDGIESAVAQAKRVAGDKNVAVGAASIVQQCLAAGLLDEINVDLVPVLLGKGVRLFDDVGIAPIDLEVVRRRRPRSHTPSLPSRTGVMTMIDPVKEERTRLHRRTMIGGVAAGIAGPALAAGLASDGAIAHATPRSAALSRSSSYAVQTGGLSSDRLQRMAETMNGYVERGILPGLVTVVSRLGETQIEALGNIAFDSNQSMRRDTPFRIASVTKPITAAAAMILVEECVLRLDDPVDELLPELANRQVLRSIDSELDDTVPANRPITLRDLLTFRPGYGLVFAPPGTYPIQQAIEESGVFPDVAAGGRLPQAPPDELMAGYGRLPLLHQPGEQYLYNSGSDILGVLIARASGMTFGEFLQERIFTPLGMTNTGFILTADERDRLPTAYWIDFQSGETVVFDSGLEGENPPAFESGGSGLISTAEDLLAFGEMMLNDGKYGDVRILSRPSIELMTTDQITPEQKAASPFFPGSWESRGWGFGVAIVTRRDTLANTPGRYGWDGGWGTSWYVDPVEGLIGILLTQRVWDGVNDISLYSDFWTSAYQAIDD